MTSNEGIKINPIHVKDASMVYSKMINLKGEMIINIAGNEVVSIKKICNIIGSQLNIDPIFIKSGVSQTDLIADIGLMKKKLFHPKISLDRGISEMITEFS